MIKLPGQEAQETYNGARNCESSVFDDKEKNAQDAQDNYSVAGQIALTKKQGVSGPVNDINNDLMSIA